MSNYISKTLTLSFCLLILVLGSGCPKRKRDVSKFLSKDTRAYLEVKEGNRVAKFFTQDNQHYKTILVLNELDNPEILRIFFTDASNKQRIWTIEFRQQRDVAPAGKRLIEEDYIETLSNSAPEFKDWKRKYSASPKTDPSLKENFIVRVNPNSTSSGFKFAEGEVIARTIKDWYCYCRNGGLASYCIISTTRCAFDNFCDVLECFESGNWTPSCDTSLQKAKACLALSE